MIIDTLHQPHLAQLQQLQQLQQTQHFFHPQNPNVQQTSSTAQQLPQNYSDTNPIRLPLQTSLVQLPPTQMAQTVDVSTIASHPCSDSSDNDDEPKQESSVSGMDRKRRRGIIEKRRRDRINNSLIELKRLVPSAYDKQGSTKLEKAEILQLTVEHLKQLHQSGYANNVAATLTQQKLESHSYGFRDCMNEVMRYLSLEEGIHQSHPLYCRLVRHLHETLLGMEQRHHLLLQQQQQQHHQQQQNQAAGLTSATTPATYPPNVSHLKAPTSASALAAAMAWSQQQHQKHATVGQVEGCFGYLPECYDMGLSFGAGQQVNMKPHYSSSTKMPTSPPTVSTAPSLNPTGYTFPLAQQTQTASTKLSPTGTLCNSSSNGPHVPTSLSSIHDSRLQPESTPPDNSSSSYLDMSGSEGNSFFSSHTIQPPPQPSSSLSNSYTSSILPPLSTQSFGSVNAYLPQIPLALTDSSSNAVYSNLFQQTSQMSMTAPPMPLTSPTNSAPQLVNQRLPKEEDTKPSLAVIRSSSTGYTWGAELAYG